MYQRKTWRKTVCGLGLWWYKIWVWKTELSLLSIWSACNFTTMGPVCETDSERLERTQKVFSFMFLAFYSRFLSRQIQNPWISWGKNNTEGTIEGCCAHNTPKSSFTAWKARIRRIWMEQSLVSCPQKTKTSLPEKGSSKGNLEYIYSNDECCWKMEILLYFAYNQPMDFKKICIVLAAHR